MFYIKSDRLCNSYVIKVQPGVIITNQGHLFFLTTKGHLLVEHLLLSQVPLFINEVHTTMVGFYLNLFLLNQVQYVKKLPT